LSVASELHCNIWYGPEYHATNYRARHVFIMIGPELYEGNNKGSQGSEINYCRYTFEGRLKGRHRKTI
jgi:hypothetical protein